MRTKAVRVSMDEKVSMDEMTIKSGLVFDKQKGMLVSFTGVGGANWDSKLLLNGHEESNK